MEVPEYNKTTSSFGCVPTSLLQAKILQNSGESMPQVANGSATHLWQVSRERLSAIFLHSASATIGVGQPCPNHASYGKSK
jgi:hypothetical protein